MPKRQYLHFWDRVSDVWVYGGFRINGYVSACAACCNAEDGKLSWKSPGPSAHDKYLEHIERSSQGRWSRDENWGRVDYSGKGKYDRGHDALNTYLCALALQSSSNSLLTTETKPRNGFASRCLNKHICKARAFLTPKSLEDASLMSAKIWIFQRTWHLTYFCIATNLCKRCPLFFY